MIQLENLPALARKYKGAPLSCLWVLTATGQRVSQSYLEAMTGYSYKTIRSALEFLKNDGLVDHQYNGWMLVTAVQLPLPHSEENGQSWETAVPSDPVNSDPNGQSRRNSDSVKQEEEVNLNINTSSSDSLNLTRGVGEIPPTEVSEELAEIEQVLSAAATLFGHEIMGDPRDYADIDRLQAWIAQAYDRQGSGRGKVENPAGLVYWAFHQGKDFKPEEKYMRDPGCYLPDSYCRNSGQWIYEDDD